MGYKDCINRATLNNLFLDGTFGLINGFQDLNDVTITEGFIPGINTLRFGVNSGDFPALNVVIVSSSVSPAPAVPALTGWAAGALAGLLLAIGVALKRA